MRNDTGHASGVDIECVTPPAWSVISSVFLIVVFCLSVGGNLSVCVVLCRRRSVRAKASMFVVNLVVCDLLSAFFAVPIELVYIFGQEEWLLGTAGYYFTMAIFAIFLAMSFLNITAVSLERFLAIQYPYRYVNWVTERRIAAVILFIWTYSVAVAALLTSTVDAETYDFVIPDPYYYPFLVMNVLLPMAIVSAVYAKLFTIARSQRRRIKAGNTPSEVRRGFSRNLKATKTVGVFFAMLVFAWLPFCTVQFLKFADVDYCTWDLADTMTLCVSYTNGALNVLVYWWRDKEFRRNVRKMIPCLATNTADLNTSMSQTVCAAPSTPKTTST